MLRYRAEEAGTIDQVSSGLVRLFGCSDAEQFRALTGNTFKGIVHPDDWEWVSASVTEQIGRSDSDYVRYRIIRADGEVRWVDDWGHLVEDAAGHPLVLRNNHGRDRARAREGGAASGERAAGDSHGAFQRRALRYRMRARAKPMCTATSKVVSAALPSRGISW